MEDEDKHCYEKYMNKTLIMLFGTIIIVFFFVSLFIGRYSDIDMITSTKILLHQLFGFFEQTWSDLDAS